MKLLFYQLAYCYLAWICIFIASAYCFLTLTGMIWCSIPMVVGILFGGWVFMRLGDLNIFEKRLKNYYLTWPKPFQNIDDVLKTAVIKIWENDESKHI